MPRRNCLDLFDSPRSDGPSSLRESFEPALQSQSHPFEQTSLHYIGERMPIQNSVQIGSETQSTGDLSQTSEEDTGVRHIGARRQVLRIASVANDCVGRDAAQQKRRRRQAGRADHNVGLSCASLQIRRDLNLNTIGS
jgi:hypothetical protein